MRAQRIAWFGLAVALSATAACQAVSDTAGVAQAPGEAAPQCDDFRTLPPDADRCAFARAHCEGEGEGAVAWLPLYYCRVAPHGRLAAALMLAACCALLGVLFRLMGRTADEFLSSILSQLCQDMGLPPRLGGVTLLAIGNGAPDLSSSIAAVRSGNYPLALGSLTGAAMFVGCVVAGRIVTLSGGVRARGAQIRDVLCQLIAVATVTGIVASGRVTYGGVATLLSLYAAYVVVVAVADFSHRAGVRWASVGQNLASRLSLRFSRPELAAPLLRWAAAGGGDDAAAGGGELQAAADGAAAEAHPTVTQLQLPSPRLKPSSSGSELELMSALQRLPLGGAAQGPDRGDGGAEVQPAAAAAPPPRNHPLPSTYDLPAGRTGSGSLPYDAILHMPASEYRKRALADMAAARSFYRRGQGPGEAGESEEEGSAEELDEAELDIERGPYTPPSVDQAEEGKAGPRPAPLLPVPPPPPPAHPHPPPDTGSDEAAAAALKSGPILRALDALCHPVILVLKATIPLIEPNAYERRWLLASAAAAPPFVCAYLGALRWGPLLTAAGAGAALCALCAAGTRAAGGKPPAWSAGTGSFPAGAAAVALAGFAVAAMWIDVFATEVVGLLHFLGLLAGVAPAVLGVSVLAWGNSMTDYMANTSMAARSPGGTSMAMTACYAGPLFNMLVGLGVGFWALLVDRHGSSAPVAFDPVVLVGCAFAAANCAGVAAAAARNGHRLPGRAGWAMVGWYGCYLAVVVAVVAAGV